jgi:hypothetical protein
VLLCQHSSAGKYDISTRSFLHWLFWLGATPDTCLEKLNKK